MKKIIHINKKINIRIDKYLYNYFFKKKISRVKIQKYINKGKILLNKKQIKKNKILKNENKIIIYLIKEKKRNKIVYNSQLDIKIFYEDTNLIIINKKPGQIVHPGIGNYNNTIINWLKYYFKYKKLKNNNLTYKNYRYGLLHRLDKNTSGLLIIAKNIKSYNFLKLQFLNRTIKKKYIALIWGIPLKHKNIIKNYIGRNKKQRIKMAVMNKQNKKYGKYSITKYKVLKSFKFLSLIKCKIKTGRTHQIRVHFKYIGHPIFNDDLYGGNKINKKYVKYKKTIIKLFKILPRQALHAYYLKYKDPSNNKYKTIISQLPFDMQKLINFFKKKN
ncbi:MAG: RluA family pseudouridine synthase [Candidatus Shikimatogenerans sp. JK-2022]|nr:RluA family pseudouridine synthase [Candidatus Shikimatogenerans bostrichidophilus]